MNSAYGWLRKITQMAAMILGCLWVHGTEAASPVAALSEQEYFPRDPENRLLWRFTRRRLEFEAIRDSMLAVSGKLDPTRGGPSALIATTMGSESAANVTWQVNPYRRTVYAAVERDRVLPLLQTFDVASPDETSSQRDITTVPTQSLFLMNSEFPMEMAAGVTERLGLSESDIDESKDAIEELYQHIFQRSPSAGELAAGRAFIEGGMKKSFSSHLKSTKPERNPSPSRMISDRGSSLFRSC
ncbi:MAG: DUF1553 domain-containing protein [Verrucomicrobiales bacterium]|nr:DUF1553 domain-containing protein [Verrucomicrobiales bacterium]